MSNDFFKLSDNRNCLILSWRALHTPKTDYGHEHKASDIESIYKCQLKELCTGKSHYAGIYKIINNFIIYFVHI